MAASAFVRVQRWRSIWAAAAGALAMVSVPGLGAAQPAPFAPPTPYALPQEPAPQPGPLPGQPAPRQPPAQPAQSQPPDPSQPPAQPYVPPDGQWQYVPPVVRPRKTIQAVHPIVRVSPGAGFHFTRADSGFPSFDLDVTAGVALNLWSADSINNDLAFEASYSFSSEPTIGGHFAAIGATPMYHFNYLVGVGWAPKLVLGGTWQGFAVGMRNMLVLPVFADLIQIEAGHQWLRVEGQDQHEIRVLAGVDLLRPLVMLSEPLRAWGSR